MRALLIAFALIVSAPAGASSTEVFGKLLQDHWTWAMKQDPISASALGVRAYDATLPDVSLAAADQRTAEAAGFLKRLEAIPSADLSPADRINRAILKRMLEEQIEGNRFGQRMILFTNRDGFHQTIAGLADIVPLRTRADYESYLTRLARYPALNDEAIGVTRQAVAKGYALPCEAMGGFEKSISGVIAADPAKSRFYEPFTRPKPFDMGDADWAAMQGRAKALIRDKLNPAYAKFDRFYIGEYQPRCARSVSVAAQPDGAAYYAYRVRQMTTTDLTPDAIHRIGLDEVARIGREMDAVARKTSAPSRAAFIAKLRTDPLYYAKTPEELMRAAARMAKTIDGKMPGLFGKLPRLPYGVKEIPAETAEGTTTAYYQPGSPETGLAGFYYVNTSKLDQRPLWELPALTAHEAVPGHHQQIALQQELDLPLFRRHLAFFTAFVEGWGLYAERLGSEMGIYDTPEKEMGRLSYEMWRACRLVVDTGIHAKGWSKAKAIAFMTENTALSPANIEAEVNRYIAWPGQALAYKLGELKISELRARAEKALGPKFDLRRFHDAVLGQGAVPLDVLEMQIDEWIAAQKGRS
jgi:uncharacterized protein (DUF885 family)